MDEIFYQVKHRNIAKSVCCPGCQGEIIYKNLFSINDVPVTANLYCQKCNHIGDLSFFKYNFTCSDPVGDYKTAELHGRVSIINRDLSPAFFFPQVNWIKNESFYFSQKPGDRFVFQSDAISVSLNLLRHSWSGMAVIKVDGISIAEIDLYEATGSVNAAYPIFLGGGLHQIEVENLECRNEKSNAGQIWVLGIHELVVDETKPPAIVYNATNAGNPYSTQFPQILATLPVDAVVLDCGSGDRCYKDPRVINFEYTHFFSPDVFGDGHHLPFKSNSFDFVLSQAVIEHLYDPFQAAREISRVLKPGGIVFCESAFMQPLHAVPYHYFNTTTWGIEELFKGFQHIHTGCEGNVADTIEWIYRLTQLRDKGYGDKIEQIIKLAKELDIHITEEELRQFGSFVTYKGRKPESTSN